MKLEIGFTMNDFKQNLSVLDRRLFRSLASYNDVSEVKIRKFILLFSLH